MEGISKKHHKIVDSFLFSEVFEKELLLLKFILESPHVDEWVILENAYSFQGEYKGLHVKELLDGDDRFHPYLHKITIISKEMQPEVLDKSNVLDEKAFKVEFWQRDLAHDYFINKYSDEDWIIISDVDEALDFTDDARCQELFNRMETDELGVLHVSTKRYWYDFDNEYKILYGIPMCTKGYLQATSQKLHDVRVEYHADLKMSWNNIIGFEYSSCFSSSYIFQKLQTGAHMGFTKNDLQKALKCNHRIVSENRKRVLKPTDKFLLDTIVLNTNNSPAYVRENLHRLKTNNIGPAYRQNRKAAYPHLFSPMYSINLFVNESAQYFRKKFKFFLRKLQIGTTVYE